MNNLSAQQTLFQRIRKMLPSNASLADFVASLLSVSNDSAYRRIRCETALTLDETKLLCENFNISLDQLLHFNNNSVIFQNSRINGELTFEKFLKDLEAQLTAIQHFSVEIIYLTKDIPLFHTFCFQPFFAFRYFFWMKSIIQHPDFRDRQFSFDCLPKHIEQTGLNITKLYNRYTSVELWNTKCNNSNIFQLELYREGGLFLCSENCDPFYCSV